MFRNDQGGGKSGQSPDLCSVVCKIFKEHMYGSRTGVCYCDVKISEDGEVCVFLSSQLVVLLLSVCSFFSDFFLPNGGSFHRVSKVLRPCCAQVYAESRLTFNKDAAC